MKLFANDAASGRRTDWSVNMRIVPVCAVFLSLLIGAAGLNTALGAEQEGIALAIIYDTSGSMKESVPDQSGGTSPKYIIANRALESIVTRLERFASNAPPGVTRALETGLFVFDGRGGAREGVHFGGFDPAALKRFARTFNNPRGNTPLGTTLKVASEAVLHSSLPRKHVLVITDGVNTAGPQPSSVLASLNQRVRTSGQTLGVHFIAFDVDAGVFAPIKRLGATVVGAANEPQLKTQLDYILQKQILLEDEEPKKK